MTDNPRQTRLARDYFKNHCNNNFDDKKLFVVNKFSKNINDRCQIIINKWGEYFYKGDPLNSVKKISNSSWKFKKILRKE